MTVGLKSIFIRRLPRLAPRWNGSHRRMIVRAFVWRRGLSKPKLYNWTQWWIPKRRQWWPRGYRLSISASGSAKVIDYNPQICPLLDQNKFQNTPPSGHPCRNAGGQEKTIQTPYRIPYPICHDHGNGPWGRWWPGIYLPTCVISWNLKCVRCVWNCARMLRICLNVKWKKIVFFRFRIAVHRR